MAEFGLSLESGNDYPSVAGIVQHPGNAEFVFDLAEGGAPEALMQGHFDLAAG